jgi:hypothetical protein
MLNNLLPQDWQPPSWHPDFGNANVELEELRSLAIAICAALPNTKATLETPEPGLMSMAIELPNGVLAQIHSIPSVQDNGRRRFAIFVSPNSEKEIEQYADSDAVALEFLKGIASHL